MARDRKRSKQRRARSRPTPARSPSTFGDAAPAPAPAPPPAPEPEQLLDGDDEAAELDAFGNEPLPLSGTGGIVPPPLRPVAVAGDGDDSGDSGEVFEDELVPGERSGELGAGPAVRPAARPSGNRVTAFLRASWAELQRVQWPNRQQVAQATAVVMGFVVVAGLFLAGADFVASKIVEAIL